MKIDVIMNGKDKITIPGNRKEIVQRPSFRCTVSEGSRVVLNAQDLMKVTDDKSVKHYSWKQIGTDVSVINDGLESDSPSFSFIAPYVKNGELITRLTFELNTKDSSGNSGDTYRATVIIKRVHRAVIFQGGVALGAYEAGVFHALVDKLVKKSKTNGQRYEKRPLFDIVAGTSIGAMNAAIVVSSIIKKNNEGMNSEDPENWRDSAKKVIEFWRTQEQLPTVADLLDMNPFYHYSWDIIHNTNKVFKRSASELIELYSNMNPLYSNMNPSLRSYADILASYLLIETSFWKDLFIDGWYVPATAESRRRYYSAKQFLRTVGPLNVATGIPLGWPAFAKFFDFNEQSNWIPRADNKHFVFFSLKRTLERFADFPIKTSPIERKEPRLLLVTVDVKTGDAVTFDSYREQTTYHDNKSTIYNENGIEVEHALASGTFPDFFDYPKFRINNPEQGIKNEAHIFWDGGFRSNTPLKEVIQAHRDYWLKTKEKQKEVESENVNEDVDEENSVPDLEVYIADLWPSELKENPISFDRDFVENRKWDLLLADKTHYDEQIANVVTDYVDLVRLLKDLAERKGAKDEVEYILNSKASSINTIGKTRIYNELLEGRFRLTKVVRIDRKDDGNEVYDKVFDYSYKSIEDLMNAGHRDASIQMDMQQLKEGIMELALMNGQDSNEIKKVRENLQKEIGKLEDSLRKIEESIKIENGYGYNTTRQLKDFVREIESIDEFNETKMLKDEKISLIASAKQLQNTISINAVNSGTGTSKQ